MEIMCPGFREIFPRMRARIGGDETLRPVRCRPVGVIAFQRRLVVFALIAEQMAEFGKRRRIGDEMIPVIMRDLMAEMG
jgi:hypothetical protein